MKVMEVYRGQAYHNAGYKKEYEESKKAVELVHHAVDETIKKMQKWHEELFVDIPEGKDDLLKEKFEKVKENLFASWKSKQDAAMKDCVAVLPELKVARRHQLELWKTTLYEGEKAKQLKEMEHPVYVKMENGKLIAERFRANVEAELMDAPYEETLKQSQPGGQALYLQKQADAMALLNSFMEDSLEIGKSYMTYNFITSGIYIYMCIYIYSFVTVWATMA